MLTTCSKHCGIRVAIASSGLGYVNRGIEIWALDTARALHQAGCDVTLFQGAGKPLEPWQRVVPCLDRAERKTLRLINGLRRFEGWRYGFGSGFSTAQTTFIPGLWARVHRSYDILHVQDSWIAFIMDRLNRLGLSRPKVVLGHGTNEEPEALRKLSHLQHLSPCYLEDWEAHRPPGQKVFAVSNFVDVDRFRPGNKAAARQEWDLPLDHLIVFSAAAIDRKVKRIDLLLSEFKLFAEECGIPVMLVVAGSREPDTEELIALGKNLLGDKVRFIESVPRDKMPSLYQASDIFALASPLEMMPIAMLEALASGLPIACNDTPVMRWMAGPAGNLNDISHEGALAQQFSALLEPCHRLELSRQARAHAEANFSESVVIDQVIDMYRHILGAKE